MKDIIYLICTASGVESMRKTFPGDCGRGRIPVKLTINMDKGNFSPPYIEQQITVNTWTKGLELEDVEFRASFITPEEAESIRQHRLEKMQEVLESQGYSVTKNDQPVAL